MIAIKCRYCGAVFSIEQWQANNFCCAQCNVSRFERRQCPTCRTVFTVERSSKNSFCPGCYEKAVEDGTAKKGRKIETAKGIKVCIVCGTPFPFIRNNALYCNEHCRKLLENKRRKERYSTFVNTICHQQNLKH